MNWEILNHKILYQGFFRLEEYRLRYDKFEGGESRVTREVFERGDAVAVIPYDPARGETVLVEQFRSGAIRFDDNPWLLELIAGMLDKNKSEEETLRHEAMEEAGCRLGELIPVHRYLSSPGGSTEAVTIYAGRADTSNLGGIHGLDEEHEDIKVHVMSVDEALELMARGRIVNSMTLIGLQWLALHRRELDRRWAG